MNAPLNRITLREAQNLTHLRRTETVTEAVIRMAYDSIRTAATNGFSNAWIGYPVPHGENWIAAVTAHLEGDGFTVGLDGTDDYNRSLKVSWTVQGGPLS